MKGAKTSNLALPSLRRNYRDVIMLDLVRYIAKMKNAGAATTTESVPRDIFVIAAGTITSNADFATADHRHVQHGSTPVPDNSISS